jgi:hypothetical protein
VPPRGTIGTEPRGTAVPVGSWPSRGRAPATADSAAFPTAPEDRPLPDVLDVAPEERGAEYPLPPVAPDRLGPLEADRPAVLIAPPPPPDEPPLEALLDPPPLDPPLEPPLLPPLEPPPPEEDPPPPAAAAAAAAIAPCADAGAGAATSQTIANADAVVNDQAGRFRFIAGTSTSAMSNPAAIAPGARSLQYRPISARPHTEIS